MRFLCSVLLAVAITTTGLSAAAAKPDEAALVLVANTLLNLDSALTK